MARFAVKIRPYVDAEIAMARSEERQGNPEPAFAYLERAHVLGQASTREHVRVHWLMLMWGVRQHRFREVVGQIARLIGAATKTAIGLVPTGNTGGSHISPFKRLPLAPELTAKISAAKVECGPPQTRPGKA